MELKLTVLAGAKQGTEIPLKKDQFIIGRAKECNLRAGSEAISRRHCAISRTNGMWMVRDLGSRNGTHVNEVRIEQEVPLKVGDELRVGPLKFRIDPAATGPAAPKAIPPLAPATEVKSRKQPAVRDVADAAQRTIGKADSQTSEEDISNWLLGIVETNGKETLKETRTISMQETKALNRMGGSIEADDTVVADAGELGEESGTSPEDTANDNKEAEKSGGWSLFRRNKAATKKAPGKLPPRTDQQSKDSREAAADILREMTRRR